MSFDAHDLDLNELIVCRNLLKDEVISHIANPATTPEGFRSGAAACTARLIQLAETQGLGGNLLRTYLLYLLVHEKNLAAQAVEEFATSLDRNLPELPTLGFLMDRLAFGTEGK